QALLITSVGLLIADNHCTRQSAFGWIAIGIGGWLTFMAKPSSAFILAAGALLYLWLAKKFAIRMALLAAVCAMALLLTSALLIDSSIEGFIHRLQLGLELTRQTESGHTLRQILRIDDFQLDNRFKLATLCILIASLLSIWGMGIKNA